MPELEIIHENKDYIVVNKSAGLISEKSPYEKCTVENQVLDHLLKTKPKPFLGVIHRLDRVTSGVLIFAKKKSILVKFNQLFSQRKIQKTYLAIVENKPPKQQDELIHFLLNNKLEKKAEIVESKVNDGKKCILSYAIIAQNDWGFLLEVKPKTGRFHQIRAQLAHIGLPIIGDEKYGSKQAYLPLSIGLHAANLSFQYADSKELVNFTAPIPSNKFWHFPSTQVLDEK